MEKALVLKPDDIGLNVATAAAEVQAKNWERAVGLAEPVYSRTHDPATGLIMLEAQLGKNVDILQSLKSLRATILPPEENAAFHQRLAEVLVAYGQFSESIEDFNKAVDLEPKRADLIFNLALAQFKAGRLDDALGSAEKCKDSGDNADIEDLLGDIHEAGGDSLAAVRSYQAAMALAPREEKYRLSLAVQFIRHENFEAAKMVLKQAEELQPSSWRIQLALGMVEFFAGSDEEASRILVHAADLAPEPVAALRYLGDIQMDLASAPAAAALDRLCQYSDRHPEDGKAQFHCGALMFRRDYISGNKSRTPEILRRLHAAAKQLPRDASPHCQLGRVYRWIEKLQEARDQAETCVHLDASSAESHYRLAQIYQRMGQKQLAEQEMKFYDAAAEHLANENARRRETMKTFLYTIQK
jgi:tetratricopeptide (TPR) repeat protein